MELSKRLNMIASFVTDGCCAADIGTDHGYIPIYLVQQGISPRAFAMDINKGPLERAKQHIEEMGLQDRIVCLLSDGLNQLPEKDVDSVIIAGMGGNLIVKILDQDQDKLKEVRELIVSPQSHPERVRRWLHDHNFRILEEDMIQEEGKYYIAIRAVHGRESYEKECFYCFGKQLIMDCSPVLLEYLDKEYRKYEKIRKTLQNGTKEHIRKRREEVEQRLDDIKEALGYYEM